MRGKIKSIDALIVDLRNQKVILDEDVAKIYEVETRVINQAVQRNGDKFPRGYVLQLNRREWNSLISQFVISKGGGTGGRTKLPKAFTEKGLYMLATVLKSRRASQATLQIVETFAKVREFSRVAKTLAVEKDATAKKHLAAESGRIIGDIFNQEFAGDTSSETTIELNLAMLKIKHTIKKTKSGR